MDHEVEPGGDDLGPLRRGEVACPEENVSHQENRESRALAFQGQMGAWRSRIYH